MSDDEDVDVQSILARLNAAPDSDEEEEEEVTVPATGNNTDAQPEEEKPKSPEKQIAEVNTKDTVAKAEALLKKEQKGSEVFVVREQADEEHEKKKRDILAEHADHVNLSPAIMSEPEKYLSLLENQPLKTVFDSIRQVYEKNSTQVFERQKVLVDYVIRTKDNSNGCLAHFSQRNMHFAKLRPEDLDKKMNEVREIDQESQKVKHYLLMLIKRLENLEEKVDHLITVKSQKKPQGPRKKIFDEKPIVKDEEIKEDLV